MLPIQINNRSRDFNKGEHDAGHDRARVETQVDAMVST